MVPPTLTPPFFCRSCGGSHSPLTLDLRMASALQSFGASMLGTSSCPVSLLRGSASCSLFACIAATCASFTLPSSLTTRQLHDIDNLSSDWHRQNGSCCRFQQPQYTPTFFCAVCFSPLSDATAVVDERLRVLGVQRLRVADASIMPTLSSGNTHAPVVHTRGMTMLQRV